MIMVKKICIEEISKKMSPVSHDDMGKLTGGFVGIGSGSQNGFAANGVCDNNDTCVNNIECSANFSCSKNKDCHFNSNCVSQSICTGNGVCGDVDGETEDDKKKEP